MCFISAIDANGKPVAFQLSLGLLFVAGCGFGIRGFFDIRLFGFFATSHQGDGHKAGKQARKETIHENTPPMRFHQTGHIDEIEKPERFTTILGF